MPQGVEHTIIRQEAVSPEVPAKPLMPQGVEHVQAIETALETGGTCQTTDAARR